jgi:hypothetical protein
MSDSVVDLQDEAWSILLRHFEDIERLWTATVDRLEPTREKRIIDIDEYTSRVANADVIRGFVERLSERMRSLAALEEWRSRYERPLGTLYDDWPGAYTFLENAVEL